MKIFRNLSLIGLGKLFLLISVQFVSLWLITCDRIVLNICIFSVTKKPLCLNCSLCYEYQVRNDYMRDVAERADPEKTIRLGCLEMRYNDFTLESGIWILSMNFGVICAFVVQFGSLGCTVKWDSDRGPDRNLEATDCKNDSVFR